VRNVQLPFGYNHLTTPYVAPLADDAAARAWIHAYDPDGKNPDPPQQSIGYAVFWAADLWHGVKKHWALEAQRLIRAKARRDRLVPDGGLKYLFCPAGRPLRRPEPRERNRTLRHVCSAGRQSRARHRRGARHRPRDALKLAAAGATSRQLLQQRRARPKRFANEVARSGGAPSRSRAASGSPIRVDEIYRGARQAFRPLDILVSNAASGVLKPTVEMTLKHWRWCMETNALALNLLAQRGLPLMAAARGSSRCRASARSARCPATASSARRRRRSSRSAARSRRSSGPRGIRVNVVSAGVVDTDALAYFPNREELLATSRAHARGPVLTPEDVAGAVYLLCLPEAAMINGHTLVVDGGFAISG
jgi:enoyl-[acyl-carrier protein] reductase III